VSSKKTAKKKASKKKKTSSKKKPASRKKKVNKTKKTSVKKKSTKKAATKKTSGKKGAAGKAGSSTEGSDKKVKKIVVKSPARRFTARTSLAQPMNPADHVPKRPKRRKKINSDLLIHGIEPYIAAAGEEYMNDTQQDHFREILHTWKTGLMEEVDRTVHHMQDEASNFPDPNDRATQESEFSLELRTRDRERKLLKKIAQAITRIDEGEYGYCEETGEEIGLKRLEARPVATLCVEAQERREVAERQYRDSDDRYR
jgi:DnaK suppressor protein